VTRGYPDSAPHKNEPIRKEKGGVRGEKRSGVTPAPKVTRFRGHKSFWGWIGRSGGVAGLGTVPNGEPEPEFTITCVLLNKSLPPL
jgi:hypothetical protein